MYLQEQQICLSAMAAEELLELAGQASREAGTASRHHHYRAAGTVRQSALEWQVHFASMVRLAAAHRWLQCGLMRGRAAEAERTSSSRSCKGERGPGTGRGKPRGGAAPRASEPGLAAGRPAGQSGHPVGALHSHRYACVGPHQSASTLTSALASSGERMEPSTTAVACSGAAGVKGSWVGPSRAEPGWLPYASRADGGGPP